MPAFCYDFSVMEGHYLRYSCSGSASKESTCAARELSPIPGLGKPGDSLGKGMVILPVFWPGEFYGLCSPWGDKKSNMTEWLLLSLLPLWKNLVYLSISSTK